MSDKRDQGNFNNGLSTKWLVGGSVLTILSTVFASMLWYYSKCTPKQRTHARDWRVEEENGDGNLVLV
jgi:hypothetical protein